MELNKLYEELIEKYASILVKDNQIISVILFGSSLNKEIVNKSDIDMLVITKNDDKVKDVMIKDSDVIVHLKYITLSRIEEYINFNKDKMCYSSELSGEILFDRTNEVTNIIDGVKKNRVESIKGYILKEFGLFIINHHNSKRLLKYGKFYDAYTCVIEAMNNWANILLIENGFEISQDTWEIVKKLNIGIYKLYEELMSSEEPIEDKIRLIHLVFENAISTKGKNYASLLFDIISNSEKMSFDEIAENEKIKSLNMKKSLEALIKEFTKRNLIKEICEKCYLPELSENSSIFEVFYSI